MNLEGLSRRMKIRAGNVPREANKVKRLAALAVDQALVLGTPVDTGQARSNWIVSIDGSTSEVIDAYSPLKGGTDPGKISETGNAEAALTQGRGEVAKAEAGQAIHITNNVQHIVPLNEGSSAQAPAMFVETAIEQGVAAVKLARTDTGK